MYSFSNLPKRHLTIEHPWQPGTVLHLEPPTLRIVRDLESGQDVEGVVQTAADILSRNREGLPVTAEEVLTHLDYDQLRSFLAHYRRWLTDTRSSDPN